MQFAGSIGASLLLSLLPAITYGSCRTKVIHTVDSIDLFLINVTKARNFSHSVWYNRQHIFIKIKSGPHSGWAEALVSKNDLDFDIAAWGTFLMELQGMQIVEAIGYVRNKFFESKWNAKQSEPTLIALYDLLGKAAIKPTIEIWGLEGREPVPGLFCILEKEVEQALIQAEIAKEQKLVGHVKVKMFGITEVDMALTKSLRRFFGKETFLMGDANRGYKGWKSIDDLATMLKKLHAEGMDAMEDPAELTPDQWIELQSKVGNFSLIPDRPMRPAYKALNLFLPQMGVYFNIHPDTMGTIKEAVELGRSIMASDRGLMIGDSSLIGPACTFWQQLAIGLGASWVEAIEKPQESQIFGKCVKQMSTRINNDGMSEITKLRPGFGIEMDESKLKAMANNYVSLF
jgi:L-alanine-DL-glutamate epimerase-like enolase superfamily enzyme